MYQAIIQEEQTWVIKVRYFIFILGFKFVSLINFKYFIIAFLIIKAIVKFTKVIDKLAMVLLIPIIDYYYFIIFLKFHFDTFKEDYYYFKEVDLIFIFL